MAFFPPLIVKIWVLSEKKIMVASSSHQATKILLIRVANLVFINIWDFFFLAQCHKDM